MAGVPSVTRIPAKQVKFVATMNVFSALTVSVIIVPPIPIVVCYFVVRVDAAGLTVVTHVLLTQIVNSQTFVVMEHARSIQPAVIIMVMIIRPSLSVPCVQACSSSLVWSPYAFTTLAEDAELNIEGWL